MNNNETMKQWLEALELAGGNLCEALHHPKKLQHEIGQPCPAVAKYDKAITSLRQAIEQAQQAEPFCYVYIENGEDFFAPKGAYVPDHAKPLYTTPPPRQPLTDKELNLIGAQWHYNLLGKDDKAELFAFARAIEAAHGIGKGEA